jgi:hypothetical protein
MRLPSRSNVKLSKIVMGLLILITVWILWDYTSSLYHHRPLKLDWVRLTFWSLYYFTWSYFDLETYFSLYYGWRSKNSEPNHISPDRDEAPPSV